MTKLQSFEIWAYRKMMKISWREKKTNEEVLTLADEHLYTVITLSSSGLYGLSGMATSALYPVIGEAWTLFFHL